MPTPHGHPEPGSAIIGSYAAQSDTRLFIMSEQYKFPTSSKLSGIKTIFLIHPSWQLVEPPQKGQPPSKGHTSEPFSHNRNLQSLNQE